MTSDPTRILIIRPSALGDVARSVPVLVNLRRAFPEAAIDWLVQDSFVEVVRHHPDLTEAVPFPRREFGAWCKGLRLGRVRGYLRSLRDRKYGLVVDAQGLARSGLLSWATRARERIGHSDAREMGPLRRLAYTRIVPSDVETHSVDRMLGLVAPVMRERRLAVDDSKWAMRLFVGEEERAWAQERVAALLGAGRPAPVVLAPTSRWAGKQWPDERFAALGRHLTAHGRDVIIVGAASEREQIPRCLEVAARAPGPGEGRALDMVGGTSIGRLMALLGGAALVVANDSAALHVAVGLDRPIVGLFGPTRAHRVGPYHREGDVVQHVRGGDTFDHKDEAHGRAMMERISVDEVVEACERRLAPGGA